jgi:cobalamin biosynthesis protein CobD/CbiB
MLALHLHKHFSAGQSSTINMQTRRKRPLLLWHRLSELLQGNSIENAHRTFVVVVGAFALVVVIVIVVAVAVVIVVVVVVAINSEAHVPLPDQLWGNLAGKSIAMF